MGSIHSSSFQQGLDFIDEMKTFRGEALSEFNFEVAQLIKQKNSWVVLKKAKKANCFIEPLGNCLSLKMVVIPGGNFMMGSPENELERFDDEGPRHEVRLGKFLMSKYPVTQSQWRFVARLDPVEREIETEPSKFKGDTHPVESVTWYDSIEFCQRLSQYSGHKYSLPTEAQWEYACRAGTTTPFHFGQTISSELANCNSTKTYNNGPQGKLHQQVTAVHHFDIANAFGL
jgi:formylglycine-generating enzyme required for sulfatase activity